MDEWLFAEVCNRQELLSAARGNLDKAIDMVKHELGCTQKFDKPFVIVHHIPPAESEDS